MFSNQPCFAGPPLVQHRVAGVKVVEGEARLRFDHRFFKQKGMPD